MFRNKQIFRRPSSGERTPHADLSHLQNRSNQEMTVPSLLINANNNTNPNSRYPLTDRHSERGNYHWRGISPDPHIPNLQSRNVQKVFFTYFNSNNQSVQKQVIEAHAPPQSGPSTNEWEKRYFQLFQQMQEFIHRHDDMIQQFISLKQPKLNQNQSSLQANERRESNLHEPMLVQLDTSLDHLSTQILEQKAIIRELEQKLQDSNRNLALIREENQIQIQELQIELARGQTAKVKMEAENEQLHIIKSQMFHEKSNLEEMLSSIQPKLIEKNIEISELQSKVENMERSNQKPKQDHSKIEQILLKMKTEYEKKEKKLEKTIDSKNQIIDELRKCLTEVEEKERSARQLKQKYEELYLEKKKEAESTKALLDSIYSSGNDDSYILHYEQRISELTEIAKKKDEKIAQMGEEIKKLEAKIAQIGDNYISQQQLTTLHKKITHCQNEILVEGGVIYDKLNNKKYDYFNGQVFEEKLIYELKKDNEKLRKMLEKFDATATFNFHTKIVNHNITINNPKTETVLGMEKLISDSFFKLERIIENAKPINEDSKSQKVYHNAEGSSKKSKKDQYEHHGKKANRSFTVDQNISKNVSKIIDDLEVMKLYIVDLSDNCSKLIKIVEKEDQKEEAEKKNKQKIEQEIYSNVLSLDVGEVAAFYRSKNQELSKRIDDLLSINHVLKEKLAERKYETKFNNEQYWKEESQQQIKINEELKKQNKQLAQKNEEGENKLIEEENKTEVLSVEVDRMKKLLQKKEKKIRQSDMKLKKLEMAIIQIKDFYRELNIEATLCHQLNKKIQLGSSRTSFTEEEIVELQQKLSSFEKIWSRIAEAQAQFSRQTNLNESNFDKIGALAEEGNILLQQLPVEANYQNNGIKLRISKIFSNMAKAVKTEEKFDSNF